MCLAEQLSIVEVKNISHSEASMSKRILVVMLASMVSVVVFAGAKSSEQTTVARAAATHEDFPFAIDFEQGAVQFNGGDLITIEEVRSTSKDMQSGICRISGTYTLASEKEATLAASVTASHSSDGKGPWNSAQRMSITKGSGSFTLMLPISVEGWPHVSFYANSSSIGGIYIGTGDSVLRRWWSSK
jgi:hypothetical protein